MATTKQGIVRKAIDDCMDLFEQGEYYQAAENFVTRLLDRKSTSWLIPNAIMAKEELRGLMFAKDREALMKHLRDKFLQYV